MKEKETIESRTFRADPEEGTWERTTGGWLTSNQAPPVRVTQLLSMIPFQTQSIMSSQKQRKKASTRREGFTASLLPAGPRMGMYSCKKKSSLIFAQELIPTQRATLDCCI